MQKWGERRRDYANILAVWPVYEPASGKWYLHEFYEDDDLPPKWRPRQIAGPAGNPRADVYATREEAFLARDNLNEQYLRILALRNLPEAQKRSLQWKTEKALIAKTRLMNEEQLMFVAAKSRNVDLKVDTSNISFTGDRGFFDDETELEELKSELTSQLIEMPYLKAALVGQGKFCQYATFKISDNTWSIPRYVYKTWALKVWRARISDGFDLNFREHWGRTKATIRERLLPDATKLLLQTDVRQMLDQALVQGEYVLVSGGFVFWYEPDNDIGWQVKVTSSESSEEGRTIWNEGKIISKNYGRIVVLPYIKENGEHVNGHTKNVAHDGPATPRQKKNYREIPFKEVKSDLMIGLFGEIYRKDFV